MNLPTVLVAASLLALERVSRARGNALGAEVLDDLTADEKRVFSSALGALGDWVSGESYPGLSKFDALLRARPSVEAVIRDISTESWRAEAVDPNRPVELYFGASGNLTAGWTPGTVLRPPHPRARRYASPLAHWTISRAVAETFAHEYHAGGKVVRAFAPVSAVLAYVPSLLEWSDRLPLDEDDPDFEFLYDAYYALGHPVTGNEMEVITRAWWPTPELRRGQRGMVTVLPGSEDQR